jgi:hypothetical protein
MPFSPAQYALADDLVVLAIINHCDTYKDYRQLRSTSRVFYRVSVQQRHKYTRRDQDNKAAMAEAIRLWRIQYVERAGLAFDDEALRREVQHKETTLHVDEIFKPALAYAQTRAMPHPHVNPDSIAILTWPKWTIMYSFLNGKDMVDELDDGEVFRAPAF